MGNVERRRGIVVPIPAHNRRNLKTVTLTVLPARGCRGELSCTGNRYSKQPQKTR